VEKEAISNKPIQRVEGRRRAIGGERRGKGEISKSSNGNTQERMV
jgi:hypothetical protein